MHLASSGCKVASMTKITTRGRVMLEAECQGCGETFTPIGEDDTEHLVREDGEACGEQGIITGELIYSRTDPASEGA
jgi:hypothetical protein